MFDAFHDVAEMAKAGNANAKAVMQSWAEGEWFTNRPAVARIHQADRIQGHRRNQHRRPLPGSRCLVAPRHPAARAGHVQDDPRRPEAGGTRCDRPDEADRRNCRTKACRWPSSATWSAPAPRVNPPPTRCCGSSATTSPGVPNKKGGGICIGGKVAPIFYNTMEDAGALVFEAPVDELGMGDVIEIRPYDGKILRRVRRQCSASSN